ncbi:MAG TPA: SAM-dependent methyltransferase [Kineosporiaceae bacterium]|nr:SAM-dependent methyltransferase [Kineosporiaceae bacterium]
MTQNRDLGPAADVARDGLDTGIPQSARVYDFLLGGKDNYEADRAVGAALVAQAPSLPVMVRAQRALLARMVRYLVVEAGIHQFLDIGTGIPTGDNVHEVAQRIVPESRVVYVDNDPIVLAHARALMRSTPRGRTAFIQADVREPEAILADPRLASVLDRDQPVALLLIGIVHHLREEDRPYDLVRRLVDWLPSGSHLAVVTPSADFDPPLMASIAATAERSGIPYVPRSKAETDRFFDGLEFVDPGLVPILAWRPDSRVKDPDAVHGWAGLARKP